MELRATTVRFKEPGQAFSLVAKAQAGKSTSLQVELHHQLQFSPTALGGRR